MSVGVQPEGREATPEAQLVQVSFDAHPAAYRHLRLRIEGHVAWVLLDVDEHGGIVPGYELKLNSYDLGVDIELYDAVQRLRFEHPEVGAVVITSAKDRSFCAGANIRMLAQSSHPWKVNFCKFTNETRNGIEDASHHSGQHYIAAVNGAAAGGGFELALACDEIILVDDASAAVSLPELPLLGVLPGTGGLTRVVDKRHVRRDLADVFATKSDGVKAQTALQWGLVDLTVPRGQFEETVHRRAVEVAAQSPRPGDAQGVELTALHRSETGDGLAYEHVTAGYDRGRGLVTISITGSDGDVPSNPEAARIQGSAFWPLAVTRELDDLVLRLRTNELQLGTWVITTQGDPDRVMAFDDLLRAHTDDWFLREVRHYYKRTLKRLDVTSRSLFALIEPGSCFAGMMLELALACDRQYMLDGVHEEAAAERPARLVLSESNLGLLPMSNGLSRLESRFYGSTQAMSRLRGAIGRGLEAAEAMELGLVTVAPDDIDWEDEVRLALEERQSFNPDALTGMEANHRFVGPETIETKIFTRLSAWQNWIFNRPNAAGPEGALRRFGTGQRASFDHTRV